MLLISYQSQLYQEWKIMSIFFSSINLSRNNLLIAQCLYYCYTIAFVMVENYRWFCLIFLHEIMYAVVLLYTFFRQKTIKFLFFRRRHTYRYNCYKCFVEMQMTNTYQTVLNQQTNCYTIFEYS